MAFIRTVANSYDVLFGINNIYCQALHERKARRGTKGDHQRKGKPLLGNLEPINSSWHGSRVWRQVQPIITSPLSGGCPTFQAATPAASRFLLQTSNFGSAYYTHTLVLYLLQASAVALHKPCPPPPGIARACAETPYILSVSSPPFNWTNAKPAGPTTDGESTLAPCRYSKSGHRDP